MAKIYEKGRGEVVDLVNEIMKEHHPQLYAHDVTVDILFIGESDKNGVLVPTLKHDGYSAAATVKSNSIKDRCLGLSDAVITVDMATWKDLSDIKRRALLDHEITHLQLVPIEKGSMIMKTDDLGRPKLKMRLHDWQLGGFTSIAQRYKDDALEVEAVHASRDEYGQYFWDWSANAIGPDGKAVDSVEISFKSRGKTTRTTLKNLKAAASKVG